MSDKATPEEIDAAVRELGWAALDLDNKVRDYHMARRLDGVPEDQRQFGFGMARERRDALDRVDAAIKRLRALLREEALRLPTGGLGSQPG